MRLGPRHRPWGWVALASFIALGLLLRPRLYVADLEAALVREANEVVAAPRARPVHVDMPVPGSFAHALRDALPRYEKAWKVFSDDPQQRNLLTAVARGERPVADVPVETTATLAALDGDLDAILAASRAERADLGPDHDPWGPFKGASWLGVLAAAEHAAIRIRARVPSEPSRNVADCLDGLALGRDAAVSGGLVGCMVRTGVVALMVPSCANAIGDVEPKEIGAVARRLRQVRDAAPSFAAVLREEAIQVQLLAYGPRLSAAAKARLLDRPRAIVEDGSLAPAGSLGPLRGRLAWRAWRSWLQAQVAAEMHTASERDAAYAAERTPLLLRLLFGADSSDGVESYARYSRRDAAAGLRLDLLVAAAAAREFHDRVGEWPSSVGALAAAGLLNADEAPRLWRLVLSEEEQGRALQLWLPLPDGDATKPSEAVVRVSVGPVPGHAR